MSEKLNLSNVDLSSKDKLNYVYKSTATLAWICMLFSLGILIVFGFLALGDDKDFMETNHSNWITYMSIIGVFFIIFAVILAWGFEYTRVIDSTINLVDSMTALYTGGAYKESLNESMKTIIGKDNKVNDKDYQEALKNRVIGSFGVTENLKNRLNSVSISETPQQSILPDLPGLTTAS